MRALSELLFFDARQFIESLLYRYDGFSSQEASVIIVSL
jgi:hypothetical protein